MQTESVPKSATQITGALYQSEYCYNSFALHPLQTYEWGIFSKQLGFEVVRHQNPYFQLIIKRNPKTGLGFGYIPKGLQPDSLYINAVRTIANRHSCFSVTLEPNLSWGYPLSHEAQAQVSHYDRTLMETGCRKTKNRLNSATFTINLRQEVEQLRQSLHPKVRYNCGVAQRHGVRMSNAKSEDDFNQFIAMFLEHVKPRLNNDQQFTADYFRTFWETFKTSPMLHVLKASREGKTLAIIVLLQFNNIFYYPFGASRNEERFAMASTYLMWEALLYARSLGGQEFDFWCALTEGETSQANSYRGVHEFFERFGGQLKTTSSAWSLIV